MRRLLFFTFLTAQLVPGIAQLNISASQYTSKDGLSQNSVNQILEDSEGYIWFATQDGLNRFNGFDFKIYRPDPEDSFAISDNFIIQMCEDRTGNIWLSTRNGINIYERSSERFYKIRPRGLPGNQCYKLTHQDGVIRFISLLDKRVTLWEVSGNIQLSNSTIELEQVGRLVKHEVPKFISYLLKDDQLWLISPNQITNSGSNEIIKNHVETPLTFTVQNWDQLVLGDKVLLSENNGMVVVDSKSKSFSRLFEGLNTQAYLKHENHIWLGTNKGVFQLSRDLRTRRVIEINDEPADKMIVHHLMKDRYGQIWIGTANNGVFVYNPQNEQFQYENQDSEGQNIVWHASEKDGKQLLGTDNGLILSGSKDYLLNHRVTATLIDQEGNYWAGTGDGRIFKVSGYNITEIPKRETLSIVDFVEVHNRIYIATHSGLFEFTNGEIRYKSIGLENLGTYLMALYVDRSENLWIAHSGGFSYITPDGVPVHVPFKQGDPKSINFNFSSGFAEGKEGQMCIATYGGGISLMGKDSLFTHYTEDDGLANNVVHGIMADEEGNFWLSSNGGISMFDPENNQFVNYTMDDGLESHNFAINSFEKLPNGLIGVGTGDGFLIFDPQVVAPAAIPPDLAFEDFQINYKFSRYSSNINATEQVILNAEDKVFAASFIGLKYDNPSDVTYSYKLEGFDEDWVTVDNNNRRISYTSLPFDDYVLKIRASSSKNHFQPVQRELPITINPPFWLSWWFITIEGLALLSLITGTIYYLSRRKLKAKLRELETREKVQAERERISRDLHDSVGTHFAYIVSRLDFLYLGWEKEALKDKKDYLSNVTDIARSGMRMLRETIWALNEEHVNSQSLKAKIDDYLKLCFSNERIGYTFHFEASINKVKATEALNSFRIIQEAVSNSLKHAQASKIAVNLTLNEGSVNLTVSDDGAGFDVQAGKEKLDHYGMENLEKRAKEMNALLNIESNTHGTTVSVSTNTP